MENKVCFVEDQFEYKGYSCAVLFIRGYRCGYVMVPEDHPCFGMKYDDIYDMFEENIHGGLTYSDDYLGMVDMTLDHWWIGFDCNHYCDKIDLETFKDVVSEDDPEYIRAKRLNDRMIFPEASIKTLDFCKDECLKIVNELERIKEESL